MIPHCNCNKKAWPFYKCRQFFLKLWNSQDFSALVVNKLQTLSKEFPLTLLKNIEKKKVTKIVFKKNVFDILEKISLLLNFYVIF